MEELNQWLGVPGTNTELPWSKPQDKHQRQEKGRVCDSTQLRRKAVGNNGAISWAAQRPLKDGRVVLGTQKPRNIHVPWQYR